MSRRKSGARARSRRGALNGSASAESVRARSDSLTAALESGAGCLPERGVYRAEVAIMKAAARTSIVGGHTVVALAGATGSGKSSLFNDLTAADIAPIGARRPTSSTPIAAIWGRESASSLLDWLKVGARHVVDERPSGGTGSGVGRLGSTTSEPGLELDGLVLLDLPDFDSLDEAHRVEADRLLDLVDVFVWVTDPQKYADARLHEEYIARLSAHDAVTIVVLNQADRLTPEALAACRKDLVRLLGLDGVHAAEVIATSATDGSGVIDLRHQISSAVAGQNAAVRRLDSDLLAVATVLRSGVADSEPSLDGSDHVGLVDALSRAAGIPVILDAVEQDYRRETWARTGWPLTRWARALRPSPLKLLRLNQGAAARSGGISESDVRSVLGRSSLPQAAPAARSAVELATRELGDRAGRGLPQAWTDAVTNSATPPGEDLADVLDQAVVNTPLRLRNPLWWAILGTLQWVFAITAVSGLLWLVIVAVLGWLQVSAVDTPHLGRLSYPFLLLAGGLLIGFLLSQLSRAMGRVGGRRLKVIVEARLRDSVADVAREHLVAPVQEVLNRHRMTREHLEAARKLS
jgi:GTP-binding protein EngB required for normal cell division